MSMRCYGVESECLCVTLKEMEKLIFENKDSVVNFENVFGKNITSYDELDNFDIEEYLAENITYLCYFGDITGSLHNDWNSYTYYNDEDLFIIELDKNDLFHSYKDYAEVYNELLNKLLNVGIKVDIDFVKKHFGRFSGSYYG